MHRSLYARCVQLAQPLAVDGGKILIVVAGQVVAVQIVWEMHQGWRQFANRVQDRPLLGFQET